MNTKRYIIYIPILLVLLLLSGCKDDEMDAGIIMTDYGDSYFILHDGDDNVSSRLTHDNVYTTTFDDGDVVGIFGLDENKNLHSADYANVRYTVATGVSINDPSGRSYKSLVAEDKARAIERGLPYYLIYYPYDPQMTLEKARSLTHSVEMDQNVDGNYEKSDLLWDIVSPATDSDGNRRKYINVVMDHAMANIIVMIPIKDVSDACSVTVLDQPVTAESIDLTDTLDEMEYTIADVDGGNDIKAWRKNDNDIYARFRVAIPACRKLEPGVPLLEVKFNDSKVKQYRLKESATDFILRPGRNYIFSLEGTTPPPSIEVDDDDSWVLDVFDPRNGKKVGLLCREYLYWSPIDTKYNETPSITKDDPAVGSQIYSSGETFFTGPCDTYYPDRAGGEDQYVINSQAWVFYPMIKNSKGVSVPDLRKGTILKFMYDLQSAGGSTYYFYRKEYPSDVNAIFPKLPAPHMNVDTYGFFRVRHGHEWVANNATETNPYNGDYGIESSYRFDYYMHGLDITWDYETNRISGCTTISEHTAAQQPGGRYGVEITTDVAYNYGHVAIDKDGNAFVSYSELDSPIQDVDGNAVGQTEIHYLVDSRVDGVVRYPIVKIGANSFWMSRDLRATSFNDGTPIKFVKPDIEDDNFVINCDPNDCEWVGENQWNGQMAWTTPSYTYNGGHMKSRGDLPEIGEMFFDPFNDEYVSSRLKNSRVPIQYNYAACIDPRLEPVSLVTGERYSIIKVDDMIALMNYIGDNFSGKLMANRNFARNGEDYVDYVSGTENLTVKDQMLDGYWPFQDWYMANISGLNLSAPGSYVTNGAMKLVSSGFGSSVSLFLAFDKDDPNGHDPNGFRKLGIFNAYTYSLYNNTYMLNYGLQGFGNKLWDGYTDKRSHGSRTTHTAPVRCVFHFDLPENIYRSGPGINNLGIGSRRSAPCVPASTMRPVSTVKLPLDEIQ